MENKVLINDDDIIEIKVVGDQTVRSVAEMGKQTELLIGNFRRSSKPVVILDDLTAIGSVTPDARSMVVELGKKLDYDRLAFLGKSGILRFGSNLILQAMGRGDKLKYFDNREKAVAWLLKKH